MTTWADQAVSFGAAADDYDQYRVGPPPEIVDVLVPAGSETVLDLGAGTGFMTRLLDARFERVLAVEPDARMRAALGRTCPGVTVLEGTAESIPLPDASVDAVTVSAAWHWMDPERAIPEVARVLKPGGGLGIVWTRQDRSVPWVADFENQRHWKNGGVDVLGRKIRSYLEDDWLPAGAAFTAVETGELAWTKTRTREQLVGLLTTYPAYINSDEADKPQILKRFADHVNGDARLGDGEFVELPMRCIYWRARRQ
jgi:ubiquinone/menaquinone biosynthesis C-methylase UbiE